tara:strand:- start:162 stop:809 length:648 start_codon:yes stop_codon:yes gene_type:complete
MKILSIKKIPIEIHYSLILLSLFLFFLELVNNGVYPTLTYSFLFIALFVSVALHEIGHALVAKRFGIITRKIILFPLGGVALLEANKIPPKEEFFISIAGPLVNFGIVALGLATLFIYDSFYIQCIVAINIIMGVFNLIPAYPMDGGRVLRSGLTVLTGNKVATKISVSISLIISLFLIFSGIFYKWISISIIGIFLIFYNLKSFKLLFSNGGSK